MEQKANKKRSKSPFPDRVLAGSPPLAVALEYQADEMDYPIMLASGRQEIASEMKRLAFRYGVPVMDAPELTAALAGTGPDEAIDPALFPGIAEVFVKLVDRPNLKREKARRSSPVWCIARLPRVICRK